jgi:hypothetical protein
MAYECVSSQRLEHGDLVSNQGGIGGGHCFGSKTNPSSIPLNERCAQHESAMIQEVRKKILHKGAHVAGIAAHDA